MHNDKTICRKNLKEIRQNISKARGKQASKNALATLTPPLKKAKKVLSFASFGSEIDISELNHFLISRNQLVFPRLSQDQLTLHHVQSFSQLEFHPWGMRQPLSNCPQVDYKQISIALIPGLGFDRQTLARIGYGKGHYDKMLKKLNDATLWGIGFHEQQFLNLPYDDFDIPMNEIFLF